VLWTKRVNGIGWRVFALVVAAWLAGCAEAEPPAGIGTRAVVIAIDGADWAIIDAIAAHGKLPNFEVLRERGVTGSIRTADDIALSPVIWTSVATGKTAEQHGISWFLVDRPDGSRAPVRSHNRKAKAIWNLLAERGRKSIAIGWWATYPAEDVGDGIIVSDALGFHGFGSTARGDRDARKTHPPELLSEVDALIPAEQQLSPEFVRRFVHVEPDTYRVEMFDPVRDARRDPNNPIHLFQQYAVTAQGYTAIAEHLLSNYDYELFMLYFEQVDSLSHLFMKYAPPQLPWVDEAEFARYRDTVAEWYIYQDELLGRVLAKIDLDTTAVFVLSDHGFKSGERRIRSEASVDMRTAHLDHEPYGIFLAAGPHIQTGATLEGASVLDVMPTLLHYLGIPIGRDMDGKVLDVFEPGFLEKHPIRYVTTHETPDDDSEAEAIEDYDSRALAENLEALRALGYAEADAKESSTEIHNNLGNAHLRRGEIDEARTEFRKALALDPNNADALLNLGSIARLKGNSGEAEHYVERALRVNPNSIGALAELAELKRDRGELTESIRLYREALILHDSSPGLYLGLGDSLQRAGRYPEAEAAFVRVLELDPDSFEARYNLGVTYGQQQRIEEALRYYEAALALRPDHPQAVSVLNNLANLYLLRGERELAVAHFERAVAASPSHFESRFNLGVQYLQAGELERGIAMLEAAVALEPNHETGNETLAMAYLSGGRNQDAYRTFLLVRRLYPNSWVAPLGLAVLHAASNDRESAQKLLSAAIELGGDVARSAAKRYPVLTEAPD
jgi:tetratricopeptide (TPR) repeat protein/predicted AlkP superfamily phosphohydrolase/phosphomutase